MTEAVFIQVGGGRVSLSSTCCLEFYFVETAFILAIFLVKDKFRKFLLKGGYVTKNSIA